MHRNPFSPAELARRLARLRQEMAARDLDRMLISSPENVFYLTGLDHWGYFAPHHLIVAPEGAPILVTRAMERVSVEAMVQAARFEGHSDSETAIAKVAALLAAAPPRRLGIEGGSAGLTFAAGAALAAALPRTGIVDATGLLDPARHVKSAEEQALMRQAGRVSAAAMAAALAALTDGAPEDEVAAQCIAAMIRAGGEPPGFGPFLRPEARLAEEHTTWGHGTHRAGGRAMLELAGCVARYHAPMGRMVAVGGPSAAPSAADAEMAALARDAFDAAVAALRPGTRARDVYAAWQGVVDAAGLPQYRRHHCGYLVGIGLPPSWTGGNTVTGLRHDSPLEIETGMSFHLLSWFTGTGRGEAFRSDCVLLAPDGPEVLTRLPDA